MVYTDFVMEKIPGVKVVYRKIASVLAFAGAITAPAPSPAQIFELVRPDVGYAGQAYGVVWGDVNGDELPDFWLSKHNPHAAIAGARGGALYVNQGDGRFVDSTSSVLAKPLAASDYHGAASGDFDNDGDSDLLQMTGSSQGFAYGVSPRVLLRNESGILRDRAQLYGVATFEGRGWMPMWLDFNHDGLLDMLHGVDPRPSPSSVFRQTPSRTFVDARVQTGYDVTDGWFAMLSDINADNRADLICVDWKGIPRIYSMANPRFNDIAPIWLSGVTIPTFSDLAIADFNNDLRPDIFITRIGFEDEVVASADHKELSLYYRGWVANVIKSLSFSAAGDIRFNFGKLAATQEIRIGGSGYNPTSGAFTLSPTALNNRGIAPHNNNVPGIYIGYDADAEQWNYVFVDKVNLDTRGAIITASGPITITNPSEVPLNPKPVPSQLLINKPGGFVDQSIESTISSRVIAGNFVASGDFDNDGDVDLYIDQAGPASNRRNFFLQNQGGGIFTRLLNHGAEGSSLGTGGSIAVADYDLDGFLDLAIVNASTHGPTFIPQNVDAPLQLFHNRGNANNWLEVRLHGSQSNRDAIGAKVIITTAAGRQLREQNNGAHFAAQDFKTLHFGLGSQTVVDRLDVTWPSGQKTRQTNIDANQIIDVVEEAASASD